MTKCQNMYSSILLMKIPYVILHDRDMTVRLSQNTSLIEAEQQASELAPYLAVNPGVPLTPLSTASSNFAVHLAGITAGSGHLEEGLLANRSALCDSIAVIHTSPILVIYV